MLDQIKCSKEEIINKLLWCCEQAIEIVYKLDPGSHTLFGDMWLCKREWDRQTFKIMMLESSINEIKILINETK